MIDAEAIQKAKIHPKFGANGWLTFYLAGNPTDLATIKPALMDAGAINLDGEDSGFIYAKIPVQIDRPEIEEVIGNVRILARNANIRIDIIDLDSSPEVETSKFYTLWKSP